MDVVLVVLIVGGAATYAGRRAWLALRQARRTSASGCGSDCGCH